MNSILLPTDFTADSELAFLIACGIARDRAFDLILLNVINPLSCSEGELCDGEVDPKSALYQTCLSEFERLKAFADGVPLSFQVKVGPNVETIIDVAEREKCALIVIAAHRHGHLHRAIRGSVTDSLSHRAKCPVVCVSPSPFEQDQELTLERMGKKIAGEPAMWPRQYQ